MPRINRAFNQAREDLRAIGLLDEGRYLDHIDCVQTPLPSFVREMGYVFDRGVPWYGRVVGFEPGVIYLPRNPPVEAYVPGGTLTDTIRHEFGHAWRWLDPKFFSLPWFRETFDARYTDEWDEAPAYDRDAYVSEYACTSPAEDFAETFMMFLRHRRSLAIFERRRGVRRKVAAVERAVKIAAVERTPRVRGPR